MSGIYVWFVIIVVLIIAIVIAFAHYLPKHKDEGEAFTLDTNGKVVHPKHEVVVERTKSGTTYNQRSKRASRKANVNARP